MGQIAACVGAETGSVAADVEDASAPRGGAEGAGEMFGG